MDRTIIQYVLVFPVLYCARDGNCLIMPKHIYNDYFIVKILYFKYYTGDNTQT